jgi:hypothetical protein
MTSMDMSFESARNRLLIWGAVMVAIYLVYLYFFPLYPQIEQSKAVLDIEMFLKDGRRWFAPFYVLGLGTLFFAYWRVLRIVHTFSRLQPEAAKSLRLWLLAIGIVCALPLLWLYPITALDVVLYVVRARLWALYGGSPMLALPASFAQDPFVRLAGEYIKQRSPYGPFWELVAQLPFRLGVTGLGSGILAMKIIALFSYIGMALLVGWHARQQSPKLEVSGLTALAFFALNPLVLLEAIGNGHNDMLLLLLMTLGLILWQREKWIWAALALTCATLIKATGLILLPLFGIAVLANASNWKTRFTRGLGISAIFVLTTLVSYRITGPIPEVFKGAEYVLVERLGFSPSYAVRILVNQFTLSLKIIRLPTEMGNILFVLYYMYLLTRLAMRKMTLLEAGFMAYFALIFLSSTFRIWYPMWLIPFAVLNLSSGTYWRTFLFSVTAEFSILMYYLLWRWALHHWTWAENGPLKEYWDYWLVMSWLTIPWTFGIPLLGPLLIRRRNRQTFDNTLWI